MPSRFVCLFLSAVALISCDPRRIQAAETPPAPTDAVQQLMVILQDPAQRDRLLTQLQAVQQAPPVQPSALGAQNPAAIKSLSSEIDRDSYRLMQRLTHRVDPWMWWIAGLLWAALVVLAGKLLEHTVARLFPNSSATWLGRTFRIFCYLICALVAVYFFLHAFGAALLAGPLLIVEQKLLLLAAAIGVADLALLLVNLTIDRYLARTDAMGRQIARSPRVLTLLPLLRNIAMVTLGSVLALIVLGEFGINIAPLLAGAGVVGVAIGFGSQKLVQDMFTGAFMLFEDSFAVGDWIKIGEHSGAVEALTIRTLRLRDAMGQLHTIPFSAITNVVNMSRDFGYFPITVHVAYDADIDKALATIVRLGAEMQADPALAGDILAPVELFGVERLGEWSVVLTGRLKTPPNRQSVVGCAFNRRVKLAFEQDGIPLAYPARLLQLQGKPA